MMINTLDLLHLIDDINNYCSFENVFVKPGEQSRTSKAKFSDCRGEKRCMNMNDFSTDDIEAFRTENDVVFGLDTTFFLDEYEDELDFINEEMEGLEVKEMMTCLFLSPEDMPEEIEDEVHQMTEQLNKPPFVNMKKVGIATHMDISRGMAQMVVMFSLASPKQSLQLVEQEIKNVINKDLESLVSR